MIVVELFCLRKNRYRRSVFGTSPSIYAVPGLSDFLKDIHYYTKKHESMEIIKPDARIQ